MLCFCPELGQCPGTQLLWGISSRLAPGPRSAAAFLCLLHAAFLLDWLLPPGPSHLFLTLLVETPADESLNGFICSKRRAAW